MTEDRLPFGPLTQEILEVIESHPDGLSLREIANRLSHARYSEVTVDLFPLTVNRYVRVAHPPRGQFRRGVVYVRTRRKVPAAMAENARERPAPRSPAPRRRLRDRVRGA